MLTTLTPILFKGSPMIDVGDKEVSERIAIATATLHARKDTLIKFRDGSLPKGDPFSVARIAGIMAVKKTSDLIPFCHEIHADHVEIEFHLDLEKEEIRVECRVKGRAKTGFEMEAMIGAIVSAVTLYDMGKGVEKGMVIDKVQLLMKSGGKSGLYSREDV